MVSQTGMHENHTGTATAMRTTPTGTMTGGTTTTDGGATTTDGTIIAMAGRGTQRPVVTGTGGASTASTTARTTLTRLLGMTQGAWTSLCAVSQQ